MSKKRTSKASYQTNRGQPALAKMPTKPYGIFGIRYWIWVVLLTVVVFGSFLLWSRSQQKRSISALREQFQMAREKGDWARCEQTAIEWGLVDPLSSEPILSAAVAAKNQNAVDRAVGYLMQLPSNAPVEVLLDLSRLQFSELDDPIHAIETTQRIAKRMPSNRDAHLQLLYYWAMTRQSSKLIEEAKRGIRDGACSLETFAYLFEGDRVRFKDELETNRRWSESWPDVECFHVAAVLAMVREAERLESKDGKSEFDPIDLRKKLDEDLALLGHTFPENQDVIAFRIQRAMNNGDAAIVRKLLKSAPVAFDRDHRYWRVKGWLLDFEQKPEEAVKEYSHSLTINPFDMQNYFERAGVYRQLGQLAQVESDTKLGLLAKELHAVFRDSDTVFSLSSAYYEGLLSFFEQAKQTDYANHIRSKLKLRQAESAFRPQAQDMSSDRRP